MCLPWKIRYLQPEVMGKCGNYWEMTKCLFLKIVKEIFWSESDENDTCNSFQNLLNKKTDSNQTNTLNDIFWKCFLTEEEKEWLCFDKAEEEKLDEVMGIIWPRDINSCNSLQIWIQTMFSCTLRFLRFYSSTKLWWYFRPNTSEKSIE